MRTRTALLLGPLVVLLAALVAGCASTVDGRPAADPPPELTAPSGQVVFQVATSPGYAPTEYVLARRPTVTIYGDGTAYVLEPDLRRSWAGQPQAFRRGHVERARLLALVAEAHRSGLFDGADFGDPTITDLGTTGVSFRPGPADEQRASAYALGYEKDAGGIDDRQRALRARLGEFVDELENSVSGGEPWPPERVDVHVRPGTTSDRAQPWPGPALDTVLGNVRTGDERDCGVVTGAAAARVFAAAHDAPGLKWTDGRRTVDLVIRALLPGESACAR